MDAERMAAAIERMGFERITVPAVLTRTPGGALAVGPAYLSYGSGVAAYMTIDSNAGRCEMSVGEPLALSDLTDGTYQVRWVIASADSVGECSVLTCRVDIIVSAEPAGSDLPRAVVRDAMTGDIL